jgi:hypothetical protein
MQDSPSSSSAVNNYILVGLAIMTGSQTATMAGIEPFASWNTPIAWTGFIIFADAMVFRARGNSWIRSSPREFIVLCLLSIPLWLVFEWFNLVLRNWHYIGLPENVPLRIFGYAWSFATIWPAIFEAAELISVMRAGTARPAPATSLRPAVPASPPVALPILGAMMLGTPFVVAPTVAQYMAAPVWLGFIPLLDPINASRGEESLLLDWRAGQFKRTQNLVLSGFLCGALWELWNYWARAKWLYTVPILENLKIFEMPLPGYLGFPAFALECFTMYVFLRSLIRRPGRPIAL